MISPKEEPRVLAADATGIPVLVELLDVDDSTVRGWALSPLVRMPECGVAEPLEVWRACLQKKHADVRVTAAARILFNDPDSQDSGAALQVLVDVLRHGERYDNTRAAQQLGWVRLPTEPTVVSALIDGATGDDLEVRAVCVEALRRVDRTALRAIDPEAADRRDIP
jgi:hypothetical protein